MRIACPSCAAAYEVPEHRLTPGKMVRCARCAGEWLPPRDVPKIAEAPEPEQHAPAPEAPPAMALFSATAMDRLAAEAPPSPRRATSLLGAWALTAVVLVAAVSAIIIWRQDFMSIWPPSGRILAPIDHMLSKPERIAGKTAG